MDEQEERGLVDDGLAESGLADGGLPETVLTDSEDVSVATPEGDGLLRRSTSCFEFEGTVASSEANVSMGPEGSDASSEAEIETEAEVTTADKWIEAEQFKADDHERVSTATEARLVPRLSKALSQVAGEARRAFECLDVNIGRPPGCPDTLPLENWVFEDAESLEKRASVRNFLRVPAKLEKFLGIGFCICLDEYLTQFTTLPFRRARALVSAKHVFATSVPHSSSVALEGALDWAHVLLLLLTTAFLYLYDISWVYHNIRGQNVIKLYVIFNIVEVFDRLCSSFGIDAFDMLGSSIGELVRSKDLHRSRMHWWSDAQQYCRVAADGLIALCYACVHATLILTWVMTLNVTVNSSGYTILVLLISNNFVELKGTVLKPVKVQNLFQIACSDAVERFQTCVFLLAILVYTGGDSGVFLTWALVFFFELVVDWIKHSFTAKYNGISHEAYGVFALVTFRELISARRHMKTDTIGGSAVAKRLGFATLPLGAFTLRALGSDLLSLSVQHKVAVVLLLFAIKAALSIFLPGYCYKKLSAFRSRNPMHYEEQLLRSLAGVNRYTVRRGRCPQHCAETTRGAFSAAVPREPLSDTLAFTAWPASSRSQKGS